MLSSNSCSCRSGTLHRRALLYVFKFRSLIWAECTYRVWKLNAGLPSICIALCIFMDCQGFYLRRGFIGAGESRLCSVILRITSSSFSTFMYIPAYHGDACGYERWNDSDAVMQLSSTLLATEPIKSDGKRFFFSISLWRFRFTFVTVFCFSDPLLWWYLVWLHWFWFYSSMFWNISLRVLCCQDWLKWVLSVILTALKNYI